MDVQHVYRDGIHAGDRGTIYRLAGGGHVAEADMAMLYADALRVYLLACRATVFTNDPRRGILVGPYSRRQASAKALGANVYIACHVNADSDEHANQARMEYMTGDRYGRSLAGCVAAELSASIPEIPSGVAVPLIAGQRGAVCIEGFTTDAKANTAAIVCEPFFGTNPRQQALMSGAGMALVGQAVGRGVATWFMTASRW